MSITLQVLSDCTITGPFGFRMHGPGELLTLPVHEALKVMNLEPSHFKIMSPTPLIAGVAVRWLLPDDRVQGPGLVQLVDGDYPDRRISVLLDGELRWIHERDIVEIDPWPAIDARLEEMADYYLIDGDESPKVQDCREWLVAHFGEEDRRV